MRVLSIMYGSLVGIATITTISTSRSSIRIVARIIWLWMHHYGLHHNLWLEQLLQKMTRLT